MSVNSSLVTKRLAAKVMEQCEQLAALTAKSGEVRRFYLTPEHKACNQQVAQWMEQAGMQVRQDPAGNIVGRYESADPQAKTLLIGSHLDTIPNAGKYDGILGVLLPISVINHLHSTGITLPYHVDVVGFGDEEGIRFGCTLLGSRAVSGDWDSEWWQLKDENGISLKQAFKEFGLDPAEISTAAYSTEQLIGYLELHIEQGPVLEQLNLPVGIVSAIAGAKRFQIELTGMAGHAGTVPMNMRQDALLGAAEITMYIERTARQFELVATVGQIQCAPNAVNVIPGSVTISLDIRSVSNETRDQAVKEIFRRLKKVCEQRHLQWQVRQIHEADAVHCAQWLQQLQRNTLDTLAFDTHTLPSGAGHDAMALANITDIGMYFIRCKGGISHHPDESVTPDDVAVSVNVLRQLLLNLNR